MKNEILKKMEKRLEELLKEKTTRTLASLRIEVLEEFKEKGEIKNYIYTKNKTNGNFYFGSCAGFDKMYKIIF